MPATEKRQLAALSGSSSNESASQPKPAAQPALSVANSVASNCQQAVYPTLRLRLRDKAEHNGNGSGSGCSQTRRAAVTEPRWQQKPQQTPSTSPTPPPTPSVLSPKRLESGSLYSVPSQSYRQQQQQPSNYSSDSRLLQTLRYSFVSSVKQSQLQTQQQQLQQQLMNLIPLQPHNMNARELKSFQRRLSFEEWLTAKKREDMQRKRDTRREEHRLNHLQKLRQQMSQKCYKDWLHAKQQRQLSCCLPTVLVESRARSQRAATQQRFEDWQRRKDHELLRQRQRHEREELERRVLAELRHKQSQLAWQRWLAQAEAKTKGQEQPPQQQQQQQQQQVKPTANIKGKGKGKSKFDANAPLLYIKPMRRAQLLEKTQSALYRRTALSLLPLRQQQAQQEAFYLHVPLSAAQRALRERLDSIDGVQMQRKRK
ncbi:putative mediator of RNA polymerase II transcription subunit 26 [Drosophila busckii]|uniref:putative mediator of RNA polymerase II transcription subunit 26 n=1 Tax=Drosophila busckii TaxID=30019 RepID=UPI00083E9ADD|nr:putative mediator of RNA polymerase II transcription subunit 26 [Drosophila busckii]